MKPHISVIVATHNRPDAIVKLAGMLAQQDFDPDDFELVVVDDASDKPVAPLLTASPMPHHVQILRIPHGGRAVARHCGALPARGDILVFLDDDMQVPPGFVAAHAAVHRRVPRAVALGHIQSIGEVGAMPLFERFNARYQERFDTAVLAGDRMPRGCNLRSANASMRQADYFSVGGFDASLRRSEDRDLGIRLEQSGCKIVCVEEARSVHASDHRDARAWLERSLLHGRSDLRIARKNLGPPDAHPWSYWALVSPASRPVLATAMAVPVLGMVLARTSYAAAVALDHLRAREAALRLTALTYGIEYFRGLRQECGSFTNLRREIRAYDLNSRPARRGPIALFRDMLRAIRADHAAMHRNWGKYRGEVGARGSLIGDLASRIGFQMMFWYRVMRFLDQARVPLMPQIVSRMIRLVFGAEIHWRARIAPGVSIVHGVGLVLSHAAEVGPGCILFHNVTLGETRDPASGRVGAPRLANDVHVGPGATLLGPIEIGSGTKIMAGVVLDHSVPAGSLVRLPQPLVTQRLFDPPGVTNSANLTPNLTP
jgi:serine O-acetyltransferase